MTLAMHALEETDAAILNRIQDDFPVCSRPFKALGDDYGIEEAEVLRRLRAAKDSGVLRQVSAIFDTNALGYKSSLVAMKVAPDRLNQAAKAVNSHPGVSHNYKRNHDFNMWFTVAVPRDGDVAWTVDRLASLAGADSARLLPTLKLFKIGVSLDLTGKRALDARGEPQYSDERRKSAARVPLTDFDIALVRALQEDIELVEEPFARAAAEVGISQERLFEEAARLQRQGHLRRFAAILRHRKAGFAANGMAVWVVPPEQTETVGPVMASFQAVSHCYLRPTYEDWPYSIFTMIHGRTKQDCEATADAIEKATGIHERTMLYSSTEFKKIRLRYFCDDLDGWESREREKARQEAGA